MSNINNINPNVGTVVIEKSSLQEEFTNASGVSIPTQYVIGTIIALNKNVDFASVGDKACVEFSALEEVPVGNDMQYFTFLSRCKYFIPKKQGAKDSIH